MLRLAKHNDAANPEEFQLVSEIINIVGRWFYDDIHCVILNAFLQRRFYKESELTALLKLPQKTIGTALAKMTGHQLFIQYYNFSDLSLT